MRTNRFGDQVLMEIKGRRAEFWFEGLGRDFKSFTEPGKYKKRKSTFGGKRLLVFCRMIRQI